MLAAVLAGSMALAACGSDNNDKSDTGGKAATPAAAKKLSGNVSVWIMDPGSPKIQGVIKDYATSFQTANPGTSIDIQFVPWAQAHDKFVTSIAGGKTPDIAEMGTTWTPEFADEGAFTQVNKPAPGQYVSSLVDAATLNGKVWGKPWYAGSRALIYRKDILKKAGVAVPKTWDDMIAAAKAIKAKVPGVFPIGYTGLSEHMYLPTIWQAGGEIAKQNGDSWTSTLNTPEAAKAIQYYTDFYKQGYSPKAAIGWEEPDAQTAFINGDIAMLIGGGWTYQSIIDTKAGLKSKIGTTLEPTGPSGKDTAFAGGSHLVVFNGSKDKDLANAFVDYMLKPDNLNKFTSSIGFLPGTVSGIKASGYLDNPTLKPFAEQLLDHSAVYPPSPRWGALEGANIFDGEIQKVMRGKETPQQAAQALAEKMDKEFAG
jgi:N,N'-diacetylchitobiose transport system substrate-binding protein